MTIAIKKRNQNTTNSMSVIAMASGLCFGFIALQLLLYVMTPASTYEALFHTDDGFALTCTVWSWQALGMSMLFMGHKNLKRYFLKAALVAVIFILPSLILPTLGDAVPVILSALHVILEPIQRIAFE